jgi:hypothetical protein
MSKKLAKKKSAIEMLSKKYFKSGMLYKTDFEEAQEIENQYRQKLADDAFRLGWEAHKTITT